MESGSSRRRKSNVLLVFAVCVLLLGPLVLFACEKVEGINLPGWLTARDATYLVGGSTDVDLRSKVNVTSFVDSEFQSALEKTIGNYIPTKATALLGYASVQRTAIHASDLLFGWSCYRSFYGSKYVYIPSEDALTARACRTSDFDLAGFDAFFEAVARAAQDNPDIDFIVYMANPNSGTAEFNPSIPLVSQGLSYADLVGRMEAAPGAEIPNMTKLDQGGYPDLDAYYSQHYRSDEHWNIQGTMVAYAKICERLNEPAIVAPAYSLIANQQFCGNIARRALDRLSVDVYDLDYDFSHLQSEDSKGNVTNLGTRLAYEEASELNRLYDFYGLYFDANKNATITGGKGSRRTLLVGDSFGSSLARPLAESSAVLYRSIALFAEQGPSTDLADHLSAHDIDSVVFVATPKDLASFIAYNPDFFAVD